MALPLACPCGARFEVEETFAGQEVACPDCGAALRVPAPRRVPLRTSAYAVASVVVALVGAFTVFGSAAAVVLGMIALRGIRRSPGRLAGAGYALFGIVAGLVFTGLTLFAYSAFEVFGVGGQVREKMMGHQIDRAGPLEVVRARDGFAIPRPSRQWGVARPDLVKELDNDSDLMLVQPALDAFLDVTVADLANRTLEQYRDQVLDGFRGNAGGPAANPGDPFHRPTGLKVRKEHRLPAAGHVEGIEVLL